MTFCFLFKYVTMGLKQDGISSPSTQVYVPSCFKCTVTYLIQKAREIPQSVVLSLHGGPMGVFLFVFKRGKHGGKCLRSLLRGGGDRQMPGVCWPANLAILVTFRPVRNVSHNIRWMALEEYHTGVHLQSHVNIWTSTLSHKSNLKGTVFH